MATYDANKTETKKVEEPLHTAEEGVDRPERPAPGKPELTEDDDNSLRGEDQLSDGDASQTTPEMKANDEGGQAAGETPGVETFEADPEPTNLEEE